MSRKACSYRPFQGDIIGQAAYRGAHSITRNNDTGTAVLLDLEACDYISHKRLSSLECFVFAR